MQKKHLRISTEPHAGYVPLVVDADSGELLKGNPDRALVRAFLEGKSGSVHAYRDGRLVWVWIPPDQLQAAKTAFGKQVKRVYLADRTEIRDSTGNAP